jgi:aminomethyltransferase
MVSRTGYTGEDGFELVVMNHLGPVLWEDLIARGAKPCGLGARDTLRLEAAMPLYGHELNETIDPIQAGLGWAVKLDKGPFLGRDALKAIAAQPESERKTRIGLVLEGKRAAREGSGILDVNQSPIGTITSGSYVPGLEKSIAMGQVPQPLAKPGTKLLVDVRGTHIPAEVVALPFYKRSA